MITIFKIYEKINDHKLEVGDYVLCNDTVPSEDIRNFISNNIGVCVNDFNVENSNDEFKSEYYEYTIQYKDIPEKLKIWRWFSIGGERTMYGEEIIYWSKNREDLEEILMSKKYNL